MKNVFETTPVNWTASADLSIRRVRNLEAITDLANDICHRFFQTSSLLLSKCKLGLLLNPIPSEDWQPRLLYDSNAGLEREDIRWIFNGVLATDPLETDARFPCPEESDRLYALVPGSIIAPQNDLIRACYEEDRDTRRCCHDLMELLQPAGASLLICAGGGSAGSPSGNMLLVKYRGDMPLRIRAMFALAFPACHLIPILESDMSSALGEISLPDNLIQTVFADLLDAVIFNKWFLESRQATADEDDEDDYSDDFECEEETQDAVSESDTPDFEDAPLVALRLNMTTYNLLRRAGISSIKELHQIPDDQLKRIRNLDRRRFEEIKERLKTWISLHPVSSALSQQKDFRGQLEELVGLETVKAQAVKLTAFAKLKQDLSEQGVASGMSLNMAFSGNPGTAKTTVARIMAGLFYEIGLLSNPVPVELGRSGLVGQYAGETAIKVREAFDNASGRLLFIDEAYSLLEHWKNGFGDEAINTIVQEIENRRDKTIVVFAGYPDKMEDFFARNPGLKSRIPFRISFPDYSPEEMARIAELEARRQGFTIEADALVKLQEICREAMSRPGFGNGRFCRNLVEGAILSYAARVYGKGCPDGEAATSDLILRASDFEDTNHSQDLEPAHRPIGFCA